MKILEKLLLDKQHEEQEVIAGLEKMLREHKAFLKELQIALEEHNE